MEEGREEQPVWDGNERPVRASCFYGRDSGTPAYLEIERVAVSAVGGNGVLHRCPVRIARDGVEDDQGVSWLHIEKRCRGTFCLDGLEVAPCTHDLLPAFAQGLFRRVRQ